MPIAFPYFESGNTQYRAYCEIYIRFHDSPDAQCRKTIVDIPSPIRIYEGNFYGSILVAITPRQKKPRSPNRCGASHQTNQLLELTDESAEKFHAAIIPWLDAINALWPIQVVTIHRNWNEGQVRFSEWHNQSIAWIPSLLTMWKHLYDTDFTQQGLHFFVAIVKVVVANSRDTEASAFQIVRARFIPFDAITTLLHQQDLRRLKVVVQRRPLSDWYLARVSDAFIAFLRSDEREPRFVTSVASWLLEDPRSIDLLVLPNASHNHVLLTAAISLQDFTFLQMVQSCISHLTHEDLYIVLQPVYQEIVRWFVPRKDWTSAIYLYDFLLGILDKLKVKHKDLSLYCNALWVIQSNNNGGREADHKLNHRFLSVCEPVGPAYPVVFYNAACLYMEMSEVDQAFDRIRKAIFYGIRGIDYRLMRNDILHHQLFAPLRAVLTFFEFIKLLPDTIDS